MAKQVPEHVLPARAAGTETGEKISVCAFDSPVGELTLAASDTALYLLEFDHTASRTHKQLSEIAKFHPHLFFESGENAILQQVQQELDEYFRRKREIFSIPLQFSGTPFQVKVWQLLLQIPYGERRSYKQQSELLGDLLAIRAVAKANGDNRISIIVPCHRVIGSDGSLTGYGGGLERKRFLLDLENRQQGLF